jgi:hypothetical protein
MAETAGKLGLSAGVAQLVERLSCKQGVSGSSPLSGFEKEPATPMISSAAETSSVPGW